MIVFFHTCARIKLFYDNSMTLIQENQTKHKKNITKNIESVLAIRQAIHQKQSQHQTLSDFTRVGEKKIEFFHTKQPLLFFSIFKNPITIQSISPTKGSHYDRLISKRRAAQWAALLFDLIFYLTVCGIATPTCVYATDYF